MEYPRLFLLSAQKNATISDIHGSETNGRWNLQFRRRLFVWENDQVGELHQRQFLSDGTRSDVLQ